MSAVTKPRRRAGLPPEWGGSVTVITNACGMLKIGDGFGIHLNVKPSRFHRMMMKWAFGWTWVADSAQLTEADHV